MKNRISTPLLSLSILLLAYAVVSAGSVKLFPVLKDNSLTERSDRLGFIDQNGILQIDFKFYYASEFSEGFAAIQLVKGGKWGYTDEKGKIAIEPQFDEAASFADGIAKVQRGGETFFINHDGENILQTKLELLGFKDGLSPAKKGDKWGFVSQNGKTAISYKFQNANPFYEELAAVTQNDHIGYIDKSGNWAIPPSLDDMPTGTDFLFLTNFSQGLAIFRENSKYGYIDKRGIKVISALYERAEPFAGDRAVVKVNQKIGYLSRTGLYAVKPTFDAGKRFSEGLAPVSINGVWGYIDGGGEMKLTPRYSSAEPFINGLAKISIYYKDTGNTMRGYINCSGEIVYSWEQ
jgi:hypothetical protein